MYIRLASLGLIFLSWSSLAFSSGMTLHIWKSDLAVERVQDAELKSLLEQNRSAYRNGSVFPDTGYIVKHAYGEYSHWHGFLNAYYRVILNRCPSLASGDCQELFSHFLGSLAHTIADINFDRHFVTAAAQIDYDGDIGVAQSWLDTGIDFLAIFEHGRAFQVPQFKLPLDALLEAYQEGGEIDVTAADLLAGSKIISLGLVAEPIGAAFTYWYYKSNMPWAAKNYYGAKGGVLDTAEKISRAWDIVWEAYQRHDPILLFDTLGSWPYADFYIDGYWLEAI